jgi:hypothetical protein
MQHEDASDADRQFRAWISRRFDGLDGAAQETVCRVLQAECRATEGVPNLPDVARGYGLDGVGFTAWMNYGAAENAFNATFADRVDAETRREIMDWTREGVATALLAGVELGRSEAFLEFFTPEAE